MNVQDAKGADRSTGRSSSRARSICSAAAGTTTRCSPATAITVQRIAGAQRQPSGLGQLRSSLTATGRQVLQRHADRRRRRRCAQRPTPRWRRRQPRLGAAAGRRQGYWAYPSDDGAVGRRRQRARWTSDGLLTQHRRRRQGGAVAAVGAGALSAIASSRFLQDDPTFLNCKPPGGPRQFQHAVRRAVRRRPRAPADLRADRRRQPQLPHHLPGRPRPAGPGAAATTTTRSTTAASVGKWEGDTLVVDTRGFNEDFWFTNGGLPHTDQLRLIERFTRPTSTR